MARIGTKQNAAKEAQKANPIKPPDFGWLNVDRYAITCHGTNRLNNSEHMRTVDEEKTTS